MATVSQKGVVKALAPGKVTITAFSRYAGEVASAPRDSVTFNVYSVIKSVKLDKKKLTIGTQEGSSYGKISIASVQPEDATNPEIEWTCNNNNVQLAVIPEGGMAKDGSFVAAGTGVTTRAGEALAVKALTPGVTKISGITKDGSNKKVSCTIIVRGQVTSLTLKTNTGKNGLNDVTFKSEGEYTGTMKAGGNMTLKPIFAINGVENEGNTKKTYSLYKKYTDTSVSYRSSDISVLTVDQKGKISVKKGISGKSAIVYVASADGSRMAQITITVK